MGLQFQSLFTIQLLHDYYSKHAGRCVDFEMVPAEDCSRLMKNMRILHKDFGSRFFTVVEATKLVNENPPPVFNLFPFSDFDNGIVFRYYLLLKNLYFSNFTAISLQMSERKRFYFSNLSKNKTGDVLSLSNNISVFSTTKIYAPGELVKGPDNNFYEAVRTSDGTAASKDLANTKYWLQAPLARPYVNINDQVTLIGENLNYKLETPATHIISKIFALTKTNENLPYDSLIETVEQVFTQNQQTVTIDFSRIKPGRYKLIVNNEQEQWVYVDPAALRQNVFGVIEVHHLDKLPADFQLLENNHLKVPEPVFTIQFKNRSIFWKYISLNGDISLADSSPSPQNFLPASGAIVTSEKPIAVSEKPITTLTASKTGTDKQIKNLKNPEIEKLVFESDGTTGFYSGNMFIKIDS